jgi:hypothetical protein
LVPMLEIVNVLVKFAQLHDIFVCDLWWRWTSSKMIWTNFMLIMF